MESVQFQKIKGARLHPFPLFLSLSSSSFFFLFLPASCKHQTLHTYTYIFVLFICVMFVTLTNTARFSYITLLCFVSSFQCFVWLPIRFRSVPLSLSLHSSTDPPHPHFTTQNRWLPHSLIFYFFRFQNFFC